MLANIPCSVLAGARQQINKDRSGWIAQAGLRPTKDLLAKSLKQLVGVTDAHHT